MATQAATPNLHPDEVDDIGANELQREGGGASESAPAPLRRATDDLGVQYVRGDYGRGDAIDPNAKGAGFTVVADVDSGQPNTVHIDNRNAFDKQPGMVVPHELYHVWTSNLPPSVAARIPRSTTRGDYEMPTVDELNQMRSAGKTLYDVPTEKAAQMMAFAGKHPDDPKVQAAMKPWLDDMRGAQRSVIDSTPSSEPADPAADIVLKAARDVAVQTGVPGAVPDAGTINTHPRAPMGPRDDIPGMEGYYHQPGNGKLIPRATAEQYMDKAGNNPARARTMAQRDGHQTAPRDAFMAVPNAKGLVEKGNLPIWNRPTVQNRDGTHSSEYSTSFQDGKGREVLVPTIVGGKFLTPDGKKPPPGSPAEKQMFHAAWQHYLKTGEHLGKFDNPGNADAYAEKLHGRGQRGRQ